MTDTTTIAGQLAAEHNPAIKRLGRDLMVAAQTLSADEARFLVDSFYVMQENRKRSDNQVRAISAEPSSLISWLADQSDTLENQIKRALDRYTDAHPVGVWMKAQYGIGPVIAAGLLAHIDIKKAPTAGHIWSFAGLNPNAEWKKGQKRPWNAGLKTLCWKTGQCFMKFSNADDCFYGKIYRERKAYEIARNDSGGNAERAKELTAKFRPTTDAYKYLTAGKLPPAQLDARARRYAVKLFLAHLQLVWWFIDTKSLPPKPYAIAHGGHAHEIMPPHADVVPGLDDAINSRK